MQYQRNRGSRVRRGLSPSRRRGFSLIIALAMMGFLLLMLVALAAFVEVETRRQQGELHQFAARANALLGLRLALAELQQTAGPDTRVTARADILTTDAGQLASGARYWTGVWDTQAEGEASEGEPVWLISGLEGGTPFTGFKEGVNEVALVGDGTAAEEVRAGVVELPQEEGALVSTRYAWWVGDEGIKAKVNVISEAVAPGNQEELSLLLAPRRYGIENITAFDGFSDLIAESGAELQRIARLGQLKWLNENIDHRDRYFDLTTNSYGVMTSTRTGGLRRDLTARMGFKATNDPVWSEPIWEAEHGGKVLEGPTWNLIREYSLLVNSTTNPANDSGAGFPILPVQKSRNYGGPPSYKSPQVYPVRPGLSPLLVFGGMSYGITAVEMELIDAGEGSVEDSILYAPKREGLQRSFRLILAMKPVVALWNPYDVAIESEEGYVMYFSSRNGGMHQFGPRILMANTSTDALDPKGNPISRNVPIAGTMPGAPRPSGPKRTIGDWPLDSSGYAIRSYNPRFSIKGPVTLVPGEVAWFSLPAGTADEFEYTEATGSDTIPKNAVHSDGWGGPELVRGFNPNAYVWTYMYGPIGSSGFSNWEGSSADIGRVDFWDPGISETITLWNWSGDTSNEDGGGVYSPREETVDRKYPIVLRFAQNDGGQFVGELYKGRLMWFGKGDDHKALNGHINENLLQFFWSPHGATTAMVMEFSDAETFIDTFVGNHPIMFSTWGIVLATPGWESARKLLTNFNPRATIHHNFRAYNFGFGVSNPGPVYHTETEGGYAVPHLFDISKIFPDEALRTVSYDGSNRTLGPILFHVPRNELVSIGQLAHLEMARNCWGPSYVVGNSYASPWFPPDDVFFTVVETEAGGGTNFPIGDEAYLTNEALWDDYFFSTYNAQRELNKELPLNPRLKIIDSARKFSDVSDAEFYAASNMLIDGPFNVNSTSVEAWKAVLSSLNQLALPFSETGEGSSSWATMEVDSPFPRTSHLSVFGGLRTEGELEFRSWRGIPELTPEQIDVIAKRIVYELRSRGKPFYTLAQFINREPYRTDPTASDLRDPHLMGLLQRVADSEYKETDLMDGEPLHDEADLYDPINPRGGSSDQIQTSDIQSLGRSDLVYFPKAFTGLRETGVPGYLLQSDLLQVLGPILSVRSDTFVIRAYGELPGLAASDGAPLARAWCEAVVQRLPDYVDSNLKPENSADTSGLASAFGRQFRVVSFRWLSPEDI